MDRLGTAIFYSTPSILCLLLLYVALPERAFLLAAAVGGRINPNTRKVIKGISFFVDSVLMLCVLLAISRHCQPRLGSYTLAATDKSVYCAGIQTGVALLLIALLFFDRITSAFFLQQSDRSLSWRCTRSAMLGSAYTTITLDFDAVLVLIGLSVLARYITLSPKETTVRRRFATRCVATYFGVCSLDALLARETGYSSASEKAYAVAFTASVLSLFWCA